jgi:cytochrome c553
MCCAESKTAVAALGVTLWLQAALCLAQSPAPSARASALDGQTLYRAYGCSACHGDAGNAPLPEHPTLAGQDAAYLVAQMRDFKKGARANGLSASMWGYLKTVPDEELVAIAQYLSKQHCR